MFRSLFTPRSYWLLVGLVGVHLLSFASLHWPIIGSIGFMGLLVLAVYLSATNLQLAIGLLMLELVIGSQGYLFSWQLGSFQLSLRIALWSVIMLAWLIKLLSNPDHYRQSLQAFTATISARYYLALIVFCSAAIIIGLNHNQVKEIFLDANSWLFLGLALPLWTEFPKLNDLKLLLKFFIIGLLYLSLETVCLAYIFSHNLGDWAPPVYTWLRSTRLAEITWTPHGFWRIFLQSHLYLAPGFLGLLFAWLSSHFNTQSRLLILPAAGLITSALFFSLSRSLWLGLGLALLIIGLVQLRTLKRFCQFLIFNLVALGLGCLLVIIIVSSGSASFAALLDRANIQTEAAASSRWQLLPVIWQAIEQRPIIGQGFGTTITYHSQDPRALAASPDGLYRTYAFEWGWLDLWLKLGLWGAAIYLAFLSYIIIKLMQAHRLINYWLALSLGSLILIHFFTPYLNHPLGFLIIILSAQISELSTLSIGEGSDSKPLA